MNRPRLSFLLTSFTLLFISLALPADVPTPSETPKQEIVTADVITTPTESPATSPEQLKIEERSARLAEVLANPPEDQPGAPRIPTPEELALSDEDPDNTAGFTSNSASFLDSLETPEPSALDPNSLAALITPEESEQRIKKRQEHKQAARAEAEKEEEKKSQEAKKRENIFETNLTGLKEAGVDVTKQGIACTGRLNIWTDQYARLTFAASTDGILAQAYMNKLDIGPLEISGVGFDGQYGTDDDGVIIELKLNGKKQRMTISGMAEFIGLLARVDLIFGTDALTFFSHLKILEHYEMKVLAESRGQGDNLDFVIMAAAKKDFLDFIEKIAIKAVGSITDTTANGIKKLENEVKKIKRGIRKLKQGQRSLRNSFNKAEQNYRRKTRHAEKAIAPLRKTIKTLETQVGKLKKEIWSLRRKFVAGRKKSLSGLRKAKERVNSLTKEVDRAKRALRKAKRRAAWHRPWMYAVVAAQAVRLGVVEAARWSAVKVLEGIMSLINIWPIDATPPLPVLWGAYGPAYSALKAAHVSLSTAMLAANPLAMKEYGEMIGLGIAISTNQMAILAQQSTLLATQTSLIAARKAVTTAGDVTEFGLKAAAFLGKHLIPVRMVGAAVQFSLRELKQGVLPKLTVMARVFGARKNLQMQLDLKRPDLFALQFPKMIVQILSPGSSGPDVMAEIESARLQFKDSFEEIDRQREAAERNKSAWEKKNEKRNAEIARIKSEADRAMQESLAKYKVTKGEGIYGSTFDLENEDANFNKSYDEFDPKNPSTYLVSQRYNNYRWTPEWKLPKLNSGSVLFLADAQRDIQVGFHSTTDALEKEHLIDLIIGAHGNQGTLIRNKKGEILAQSRDTEARITLENADDFSLKPYWVTYHDGYIACGRGTTPGKELMIEWQLKQPPADIQYFSFSSHDNRIQYGGIRAGSAYSRAFGTRYSTFEGFNSFAWPHAFALPKNDSGTITFKAKAHRDLIVGLTHDTSKKHARLMARIGMDGNTRSALVNIDQSGKEYNHMTITEDKDALVQGNGTEYASYWLTYHDNFLIFGHGDEPQKNIMLEAVVNTPPGSISRFSFSSWDNNVEVRDIVVRDAVPVQTGTRHSAVNQNGVHHYRDEWQLPQTGKGTITWNAKGSSDMMIGLHTSNVANPDNHTYQVVIGAENNSKTLIRNTAHEVLATTNDPDGVITETDNYSSYWLTYDHGTESKPGYIALGVGSVPGANIILEYDGAQEPITHFSFSNQKGFVSFNDIASRTIVPVPRGSQYHSHSEKGSFTWRPDWFIADQQEGGVIIFQARAHESILCGLSASGDGTPDYHIAFGAEENSRSFIKDKTGTTIAQGQSHIEDANNFYNYWVWYDRANKKLSCGRGFDPSKYEIMSASIPNGPELQLFSLSSNASPILYKGIGSYTRASSILAYRIEMQQSSYHALAERGVYTWRTGWSFDTPHAGAVIFSARGARNINIGLHTSGSASPGSKSYEVLIGDANNTQTVIKKHDGTIGAQSSDADALIRAPGNYATYWVSYYKGHIRLGRGAKIGESVVLEWNDPSPIKGISHFSLSSNDARVSYRSIVTETSERAPLFTTYSAHKKNGAFIWPDQWKLSETERGAFTFEAKAGHDISLGIARNQKSGPLYIVTLGANGNSNSAITKAQVVKTSTTPDARIADTTTFQPYWILYDRGYLAAGHGTDVGEDTMIEWQDPRPTLLGNFLSFSSANNQVSYRNINTAPIPKGSYQRFKHFTSAAANKTYTYRDAWKLPPEGGVVTFRAQGPENIRIGLHDHKGSNTRRFTYEIAIGAKGNTETHIKSKAGTVVNRSTSSNASIMLPDQVNQYWFSYKNGHLTLGSGGIPGEDVIISWKDPIKRGTIPYFSFSSGEKEVRYSNVKVSEYVSSKEQNRYTATNRNGEYKVRNSWEFVTPGSGTIVTKVQAAHDAMIGLLTSNTGQPVYDVIIGSENNKETVLRKNGNVVARVDHRIKNMNPHPYWLSIHDGIITFGSGLTAGKEELIRWQDDEKTAIRYFGFSNQKNDANFMDITVTEGNVVARDTFYVSERKLGSMTWNNESWKITPNSTFTLTADAPQSDIRIGLRSLGAGPALYTIRLGGWRNTKCAILKGDTIIAEHDKHLKLGKKNIWITNLYDAQKKELRLIVGTGEPGHKILLDTTVQNIRRALKYFGLSSGDSTVTYGSFATQDPVTEVNVEVVEEQEAQPEETVINESIDAFAIDTDALVTAEPEPMPMGV